MVITILFWIKGSSPHTTATEFGQGTGPILINQLQCSGDESEILNCPYSPFLLSSCSHYYDAGVVCEGMVCIMILTNWNIHNTFCVIFS